MSEQKTLAEVLAEHRIFGFKGSNTERACVCGAWRCPEQGMPTESEHLQAVVLAHLASEQVVEAVAKAIRAEGFGVIPWGDLNPDVQEMWRDDARAALAAQREVLGGEGGG